MYTLHSEIVTYSFMMFSHVYCLCTMFCDTDSKLYLNLYLKHFKMKFCLFYMCGLCVGE